MDDHDGKGAHLGLYHIGTSEEVTMADLASGRQVFGREIELQPGPLLKGDPSQVPGYREAERPGFNKSSRSTSFVACGSLVR